jgi:hypothetical protein
MRKRKILSLASSLGICISLLLLSSCAKNKNSENAMPTAIIAVDTTRGDTSTLFHFDASGSSDKEDPTSALMVAWNFGENSAGYSPFSTTKTATHTFAQKNSYTVKLIVKDTQGLSDTTTQIIEIVDNLANLPPNIPIYTAPENLSTALPVSVHLTWLCTDPENDQLSFDIYMGKYSALLYLINSNITAKEYTVTGIEKGTTYFWRIVARDPNGNTVNGDVWNFTTAP